MTYNKKDTKYYQAAVKLRKAFQELRPKFEEKWEVIDPDTELAPLDPDLIPRVFEYNTEYEPKKLPKIKFVATAAPEVASPKLKLKVKAPVAIESMSPAERVKFRTVQRESAQFDHRETGTPTKRARRLEVPHTAPAKANRSDKVPKLELKLPPTTTPIKSTPIQLKSPLLSKKRKRDSLKSSVILPIPDTTQLQDGDFVWAKMIGFPFHPAEVIHIKKRPNLVPKNIKNAKHGSNDVLVLFFEPGLRTWAWIPLASLRAWDAETNEYMLEQKAKEGHSKKVFEGYKLALKYAKSFQDADGNV